MFASALQARCKMEHLIEWPRDAQTSGTMAEPVEEIRHDEAYLFRRGLRAGPPQPRVLQPSLPMREGRRSSSAASAATYRLHGSRLRTARRQARLVQSPLEEVVAQWLPDEWPLGLAPRLARPLLAEGKQDRHVLAVATYGGAGRVWQVSPATRPTEVSPPGLLRTERGPDTRRPDDRPPLSGSGLRESGSSRSGDHGRECAAGRPVLEARAG